MKNILLSFILIFIVVCVSGFFDNEITSLSDNVLPDLSKKGTSKPSVMSNWSGPIALSPPINVDGGWVDMPVIDYSMSMVNPEKDVLFFAYWNGASYLDAECDADDIGPQRLYNHDGPSSEPNLSLHNFDIYWSPAEGDTEPQALSPCYTTPGDPIYCNEKHSTSIDMAYLEFINGTDGDPNKVCCNKEKCADPDTGKCDIADSCMEYESLECDPNWYTHVDFGPIKTCSMGHELAAARSFNGKELYITRNVLEYDPNSQCLWKTTKIYLSKRDDQGEWTDAEPLPETINRPGYGQDMPTLSPDRTTLCFGRAKIEQAEEYGDMAYSINCSHRECKEGGGECGDWTEMEFQYRLDLNKPGASCADWQPMFTPGGNLLFTSNRKWCYDPAENGISIHFAERKGEPPNEKYIVDEEIFAPLQHFEEYHLEGAGSLSPDGKRFYFLRVTNPLGSGGCDLEGKIFMSTCETCSTL